MPYQFVNPALVFADIIGAQPNVNGFVQFFDIGTTDEKDTWSDYDMTTANANPLQLDPDGRLPNEVWLDGNYTVRVSDSLDATIATFDIRPEVAATQELPAHEAGKYLASDGANWILVDISESLLPDPTGSTSHYLTTNGSGWQITPIPTPAAAPTPDIVVTQTPNASFRAGVSSNNTKFFVQWGTASAPATGAVDTTLAVTFATPFKTGTTPFVSIQTNSASQPGGPTIGELASTPTSTGFTVRFDVAEGTSSGRNIVNPVPFGWLAAGFIEITPP